MSVIDMRNYSIEVSKELNDKVEKMRTDKSIPDESITIVINNVEYDTSIRKLFCRAKIDSKDKKNI